MDTWQDDVLARSIGVIIAVVEPQSKRHKRCLTHELSKILKKQGSTVRVFKPHPQTHTKSILNLQKAMYLRLFLVAQFHLLFQPQHHFSLQFLWTLRSSEVGQPRKASAAEAEARRQE